ncbi:MAG: hypothetical protein ACLQIK_00720 [Mycobacterium sp.]|uniref:hypothetical protein n=1 Tax=Mycobacterium sp. TaxID=1785 RepID=UPI003F94358D
MVTLVEAAPKSIKQVKSSLVISVLEGLALRCTSYCGYFRSVIDSHSHPYYPRRRPRPVQRIKRGILLNLPLNGFLR